MSFDITIRKFAPRDADGVISLWHQALPSSQPWNEPRTVICRKLSVNDDLFFVGQRDGHVIATVLAGHDGVRGWIYALAVAPEHRRQGVGRRMLDEAERALLARGCDKINLQVRSTNAEVIEFYQRCGFSVESRTSLGKPLRVGKEVIVDAVPNIRVNDEITLSQVTGDDKSAIRKHLNESEEFHLFTDVMPFPYQEIDADAEIWKANRETLEANRRRTWAIRGKDGQLLGQSGLYGITRGEMAEIGYWLAKPLWGRGIVTEVVRRLCDFAFDEYELRRIFGRVFATNPASARVLTKAGFEREGTLRSHHFFRGQAIDVLYFGKVRPA